MNSTIAQNSRSATPFIEFSPEEKQRLIREAVAGNYNLSGDNLPYIKTAIGHLSNAESAISIAEVVGLLGESAAVGSVTSALGFMSALAFPAGSLLAVVDAKQAGLRMYGMRAVSYTITAWSFKDAIPMESRTIIRNIQSLAMPRVPDDKVREYHDAWRKASSATISSLQSTAVRKGILESSIRVFYRSVGDDSRKTLCRMLLEGFESHLSAIERITWKSNYGTLYPN